MGYSDHKWLREGEALGFEMDRDSMKRTFIRMQPAERISWLQRFDQYIEADQSPLRKRAQLFNIKRDLTQINLELKAAGR